MSISRETIFQMFADTKHWYVYRTMLIVSKPFFLIVLNKNQEPMSCITMRMFKVTWRILSNQGASFQRSIVKTCLWHWLLERSDATSTHLLTSYWRWICLVQNLPKSAVWVWGKGTGHWWPLKASSKKGLPKHLWHSSKYLRYNWSRCKCRI